MMEFLDFIFDQGLMGTLSWAEKSHGLTIAVINVGKELIGFYSLLIGKNNFLM